MAFLVAASSRPLRSFDWSGTPGNYGAFIVRLITNEGVDLEVGANSRSRLRSRLY